MENINIKKDVRPEMDAIKVIGNPLNLSDFWFYVEGIKDDDGNPLVFHVAEGTGDNLLPEDVDEGFNDYIYYEVYDGKVTYSLIDEYEQGTGNTLEKMEMDGGQVMLYGFYKELTLRQICWKTLGFFGVENPGECTVRILSGKFADPSFPTGGTPTETKDGPLSARNIVIAVWAKNGGDFMKTLKFIQRKEPLRKEETLVYVEMVNQVVDELGGKLITIMDPDYPETCKRKNNPPFCVIIKDDTIYTEIQFSLKKPLRKSSK